MLPSDAAKRIGGNADLCRGLSTLARSRRLALQVLEDEVLEAARHKRFARPDTNANVAARQALSVPHLPDDVPVHLESQGRRAVTDAADGDVVRFVGNVRAP